MKPLLTVLLPVFNERNTFLAVLHAVRAVPIEKEILILDDASSDGTRDLLLTTVDGVYPDVRVYYHASNLGKGAALRTLIPYARGTYCIVQDGDMEYDPQDYLSMIAAFENKKASVVYGSRFIHGMPPMRPANRLVNILLAWMVRVLFGASITDEATCYKAFDTELLQSIPLTCRRFEFCPEVTAKVLRRGYNIAEVPVSYSARTFAEGKKIRWTDGVEAIWTLIKFRFVK